MAIKVGKSVRPVGSRRIYDFHSLTLRYKIDALEARSPGHAKALERLVEQILEDLDAGKARPLP